MFAEGVFTVWTEHSERATMRTWAEAAGVPESVRKQLGRWTSSVDQSYERTTRYNTLKAQSRVANFVKSSRGRRDPFEEALIMSALSERMERLGHTEGAIVIHQVEKLIASAR